MEKRALMDALVQTKRMGNLLNEVLDLTRQLAEAVDRDDQISVQMLLSMRREPIEKMKVTDQALRQQRDSLPEADGRRLAALLNGGSAAAGDEAPLAAQVAANARRLDQVVELDRVVNRKLARDSSVYAQKP